jgi:endonuclease/exonuclease/phosphatase family metal-dependent hydrolase
MTPGNSRGSQRLTILPATTFLTVARQIEVVLAGDFNTDATSESVLKSLNAICNLELISNSDTIRTSYKMGKSCIDHALASNQLATKVISVEYRGYPDDYFTDHTPKLLILILETMEETYSTLPS